MPSVFFGRNRKLLRLAALWRKFVHHHVKQIDDGIEAVALLYGILHECNRFAETALGGFDGCIEIRFMMIDVVDSKQNWFLKFLDVIPDELGADFHVGTPESVDPRVALVIPPTTGLAGTGIDPASIAGRTMSNPPLVAEV